MSRRITTETSMTEKAHVLAAAKQAGITCETRGDDTVSFTSGKLRGASLDLRSGRITGDTDRQSEQDLDLLRQGYAFSKYKAEVEKSGASMTDVQQEGEDLTFLVHIA